MGIILGIIGIVPAMLMIIGIASIFRTGTRYGRHKERRTMKQ